MFVIHDVRKIIFAETVKESFCLKQPNFSKMVSILQRIFFFFSFLFIILDSLAVTVKQKRLL